MDSQNNSLLTLLFPQGFPKNWESDPTFADYVSKIGTYTCDELTREPGRLLEDRSIISEQTQDFAVSHYRTFIETADCSRKSSHQFKDVETRLDGLLQNVPTFEERCTTFAERSDGINNLRKLNSLTLVRNAQLLEILELPQLMDGFIKDHLYEDALELAVYVQRLYTKHPDIPIFKNIAESVDKLWNVMLHQLLLQLRSDIQLPKCLQIVGHLRRMGAFTESELRLKFLQARNHWLTCSLDAIPTKDANQHLSKTIEITRVNLFNIITQYRAIFNDDDHAPLVATKHQNVNQNCIFFCWLKQKISNFLETLRNDLNGGVTSVDSFLGQCMYFGLSFSKVGCDFRLQMLPIFLNAITMNFENSVNAATADFQRNMEKFTLINKNHPNVPWRSKGGDPTQPPDGLLEFYPLADYTNKVLTSFNSLRLCAPISIVSDVVACLERSLLKVSELIHALYGQEHQAFTPIAKDAFTRLCMCFADDLVPYLQKALLIIYPTTHLAQYLGVNVQVIQAEKIAFLDREKIIEKMQPLLPVKISPIVCSDKVTVVTDDLNAEV